ncbi:MAG: T9SS type A sorting domain-containing protein [Saprospiraceae bacterium]|nr:T9SS type A sorting domain-containing protein [Candidatus Vicinibacter affinis]MBK7303586.1 T9SS type A sorting domain-containing protein [Candidatus Vicinibacter affinis]MBK7696475.1 T9SS type A sorting domain-containing protein [Candidatus Vicinibacter affinis]MBK7800560.1 T9SS type A sorting domain-containing protein [Candidatus Vicinibacter affinis]MBP6523129.1 T9SS type A sorting domain-containing protein [Saprospiraceae bacterium]
MKTKIFATVSAKLNSYPPHFSLLKFGFLKPVIASIMATLFTIALPGLVNGQCPSSYSGQMGNNQPYTPCGFNTIDVLMNTSNNFTAYTGIVNGNFSSNVKILSISNSSGVTSSISGDYNFTINLNNKSITSGTAISLATITYTLMTGNSASAVTTFTRVTAVDPGAPGGYTLCTTGGNASSESISLAQRTLEGNVLIPSEFSCTSGSTNHGLPERDIAIDMNYNPYYNICTITDTPSDGFYECEELRNGCKYKVCVTHENEQACGIDEFDLDVIRDHILGTDCFDWVWQLYAADVNNNGSISTADVLQIQNILNNVSATMPLMWKYINYTEYVAQVLINQNDNCNADIPVADNCAEITISSNPTVEDWYGFPVGDVNYSCTSCEFASAPVSRSYTLGENFQNILINHTNTNELVLHFDCPFKVNVWSMVLQNLALQNEIVAVYQDDKESNSFAWNYEKQTNQLRMSYVSNSIFTKRNFKINIIYKSKLEINGSCMRLVNGDPKIHNLIIGENGSYSYFDQPVFNHDSGFTIYPIPTTNYLSFLGEIPEEHQLKIYSSNGIEVYSGKVVEKTINTSNFPPGIYFLELFSNSKSIFKKVFISKVH